MKAGSALRWWFTAVCTSSGARILLHRARELLQSLLKSPATSPIRDRRASGFTHGAAADGGARSAAKRWK
jgi:hypothetical protein